MGPDFRDPFPSASAGPTVRVRLRVWGWGWRPRVAMWSGRLAEQPSTSPDIRPNLVPDSALLCSDGAARRPATHAGPEAGGQGPGVEPPGGRGHGTGSPADVAAGTGRAGVVAAEKRSRVHL